MYVFMHVRSMNIMNCNNVLLLKIIIAHNDYLLTTMMLTMQLMIVIVMPIVVIAVVHSYANSGGDVINGCDSDDSGNGSCGSSGSVVVIMV